MLYLPLSCYYDAAVGAPNNCPDSALSWGETLQRQIKQNKKNENNSPTMLFPCSFFLFLCHWFCFSAKRDRDGESKRGREREKNFFHKAVICAKNYCLPHVWSFSYVALPCILIYIILPTYRPTYLLTYLPTCLLTYLLSYLPTYLLTYLLTYVLTFLLTYLPTYLPTYQPTYLLTYLPAY